jgi:hypothetical protein
MNPKDDTMWFLLAGLLLYTALIVGVSLLLPGNEKLYALLAGVMGNFSGGLFMYLKMQP